MVTKIIVLLFLALILFNLGAALVYMMKDQGKGTRTARALSWRIGLSILLFVLLIAGRATGFLGANPSPITGEPEPKVFGND
ncbi:MAG: twin transmembrane helix small protein [Pseudomonadota bacterium]